MKVRQCKSDKAYQERVAKGREAKGELGRSAKISKPIFSKRPVRNDTESSIGKVHSLCRRDQWNFYVIEHERFFHSVSD